MNFRLSYTHGQGWFVEAQETPHAPWVPASTPRPTLEGAIVAAGMGQTVSLQFWNPPV